MASLPLKLRPPPNIHRKADGVFYREGPPRIKVAPEFVVVWDLPDALSQAGTSEK